MVVEVDMVVILMMKSMSQMISCTNNWRSETKQKQKNWQRDTDKKTKLQKKISGTQQYNETLEPSRLQDFPLVFLGKSIGRRRCTSQQHTSRWLLSNLHHLLQKTQMWWYGNIRENPILVRFNDKHMGWQCDIWYCDILYLILAPESNIQGSCCPQKSAGARARKQQTVQFCFSINCK